MKNNVRIDEEAKHSAEESDKKKDKIIPIRLRGNFYKIVVRPALLYGLVFGVDKKLEHKMRAAEMRILR